MTYQTFFSINPAGPGNLRSYSSLEYFSALGESKELGDLCLAATGEKA